MASKILEILDKCERRLSKKAKRADIELDISGQSVFNLCETTQGDDWQRLFIAIIQVHLESYSVTANKLHFQSITSQHTRLSIENLSAAIWQGENMEKLTQSSAVIDALTITKCETSIELNFNLDILSEVKNHKLILCADDNPDNRQIMQLLLEKMGHKVCTAENGELALQATLEQEFDLIFLDIQMPVMDGIEALELIRSTACETPIIAFTAQVFDHEVSHLLDLGFNAWLAKPIDRHKLDEILEQYLDSQSPQESIEIDSAELDALTHTYQQSLPQYIDDINTALEAQNSSELARLAHALKGSGGNFGFHDITQTAGQLEQACYATPDIIPTELTETLTALLKKYKK
ncbi:Hpt domain-containing response regulator [Marinomonas sp. PE14-40]|uniref:Hpt domain-containing response regulator n=1 Tax=Marinomonas sp. PE14-40 TaxID=3060621 RepID=UPI003F67A5FE